MKNSRKASSFLDTGKAVLKKTGQVFDDFFFGAKRVLSDNGGYMDVDAILHPVKAKNAPIDDVVTSSSKTVDFYVTPKGDVIPATRSGLYNNLSLLDDVNGKYIGDSASGPVRIRIEDAHSPTSNYLSSTDNDHLVDHIHVEHRQNSYTGAWGRGKDNNTSLPQDWLR